MAVVTNTRSPQTMGLEWARPGNRVFQAMFLPSAADQVSGRRVPSATPEAPGPRNWGQWEPAAFPSASAPTATTSESITVQGRFIGILRADATPHGCENQRA